MITAYSHSTPFSFDLALAKAKLNFPNIDYSTASTPLLLESLLLSAGEVLFVDANFEDQTYEALAAEYLLSSDIAKDLEILSCDEDGVPVIYDQTELDAADTCEIRPEFSDPILIDEFAKEISDIEIGISNISDQLNVDISKILACVNDMKVIANDMNLLVTNESRIRETMVNLEELTYNYRVMSGYFKKRTDRLDEILGIFDPLIRTKQRLEDEIKIFTPVKDLSITKFNELDAVISTGTYTQDQYTSWQSAKNKADSDTKHLNKLGVDLETTLGMLEFQQNKISPFLDTDVTTVNTGQYGDNAEYRRQQFLKDRLSELVNEDSSGFDRVKQFSDKVRVKQIDNNFTLEIEHTIIDQNVILDGRPKNYMQNCSSVTMSSSSDTKIYSGILYEQLYNIWSDDEKFFSKGEKGITDNKNDADILLRGSGAESFKDGFVADSEKFRSFYENFVALWEGKVSVIKDTVIEPAISSIMSELNMSAIREIEFLLAYGNAFQKIQSEDQQLGDIINHIRNSSTEYTDRLIELNIDYMYVRGLHDLAIQNIEKQKQKYKAVQCALNTASVESVEIEGAGSDPLGITSLLSVDPSKPDPTKWCYWKKFALCATAVGVLPLIGDGGFRYWPIGLVIPGPNGVTKIPLPVVWIPLAIIPLPIGTFVIFIGLCGLCPSPIVFFVGPNGEKKFVVSMRPGEEFGTNAEKPAIKTVENLGIGVNTKISDMLNKIDVPEFKRVDNDEKSSLIADVKDKITNKIQKMKDLPDVSRLNNLDPSASIQDKLNAFKKSVSEWVDKVKVPDIKYPKNSEKLNPKPTPVSDMMDKMKESFGLDLPEIAIPETDRINLNTKLAEAAEKVNLENLEFEIKIPQGVDQLANNSVEYVQSVRDSLKKIISSVSITPVQLGIVSQVLSGVTFNNPYKCAPGTTGIEVPAIPSLVVGGIVTVVRLANEVTDNITSSDIDKALGGRTVTKDNIKKLLTNIIGSMPIVDVPNPSTISIKDMIAESVKKLGAVQLPSLPNISIPVQLRVVIPGSVLEGSIKKGVNTTLNSFPIDAINIKDLSPIDLKQIILNIVEDSFLPVEAAIGPLLDKVKGFKVSKDKTFPEMLNMKKVSPDTDKVIVVSEDSMDKAIDVLKALSFIPYPAVAFAPDLFKNLHPALAHDELPPWARFSLDNFLFVVFLDEWCRQGKSVSGFFENP